MGFGLIFVIVVPFFFSRKGSHLVFILLAHTGSNWGDMEKVGGVPLKAQELFSKILKVCMVENKTQVQGERVPCNSKFSTEISNFPSPLKKRELKKKGKHCEVLPLQLTGMCHCCFPPLLEQQSSRVWQRA